MTIRVTVASDQNYVLPLAACVRSILDNGGDVEIAILSCGISADAKLKLYSSWNDRADCVRWVDVDQSSLSHLPTTSRIQNHLTTATYARLLLPSVLPIEWERVIFLDTDTITLDTLAPLWEMSLDGKPLAAASDPYNSTISSQAGVPSWRNLGLNPNAPYFNAGVMLMDLPRWRDEKISQNCINYVVNHRDEVLLADQDGLNAAFNGRFKTLDPTWNVMTYWYLLNRNDDAAKAIVRQARIRHFNGALKPWHSVSRGRFERAKVLHMSGSGREAATDLSRPHLDFEMFFKSLDRTAWHRWAALLRTRSPSRTFTAKTSI